MLTKTSGSLYDCNFLGIVSMGKAYQVHGRRKYVEYSKGKLTPLQARCSPEGV
jgi:hypothetical protein